MFEGYSAENFTTFEGYTAARRATITSLDGDLSPLSVLRRSKKAGSCSMTLPSYLPRLDHSMTGDDARPHLGAVLLKSKTLTPEQLDEALAQQAGTGRRLGEILVERGWLFPQDIARALATQFGVEYIDIQHISVDPAAAAKLNPEIGQRCAAIGVRVLTDGTLLVAVADPTSEALKEVSESVDRPVAFAVTERDDIKHAWRRLLQGYRP